MFEGIYETLEKIGYTHPLHPTLTHLPIGIVFAVFVFALIAMVFKRQSLSTTIRHCLIFGIASMPPVVLLGVMDWQHFYAGAWLFPITVKVVLAGALFIALVVALFTIARPGRLNGRSIGFYTVSILLVIGLGYFGGELVYGKNEPGTESGNQNLSALAEEGASVFNQNCAGCHFADRAETKVGPGLKALYQKENMAVSGWNVTDDNVRRQIRTPYDNMPAFPDLTDQEIRAVIAYLRTL